VKVMLVWGIEPDVERESIRLISALARECEVQEMPLMIEPVLWGAAIAEDRRSDPDLIAHACRITVEMGADIVKAPYVADAQALAALVRNTPVPIVLLGGPRIDDAYAVPRIAEQARDAGVKGLVFGRNVFQRPNAAHMIRALRALMHQQASVAAATALLEPAGA
jgi:class I fructose-bisphosphate aldolase